MKLIRTDFHFQINQEKIYEYQTKDGEKLIPLKPMCKALRIDYTDQKKKMKTHKILSQLVVLSPSVAADNKERDMLCLPIKAAIFWIMSINPNKTHEHFWILQVKLYDMMMKNYYQKTLFELRKKVRIEQKMDEIKSIKSIKWDQQMKKDDIWTSFDQNEQGELF